MILVLGTAMWGWTIDHNQAFALADRFYALGGRWFDTASKYPINKNPVHFGLAAHWLGEWVVSRDVADAHVLIKVGALRNDGSAVCDLGPNALRAQFDA